MNRKAIKLVIGILLISGIYTSCNSDDDTIYINEKSDITLSKPEGSLQIIVDDILTIQAQSNATAPHTYQWFVDDTLINSTSNFEYTFTEGGTFDVKLLVNQFNTTFEYVYEIDVIYQDIEAPGDGATPYITKVLDYLPAIGQFTNKLPVYDQGDTQEIMNQKVLDKIGNNNQSMITLGGYGGYVVVGFDHTIQNVSGKRDFRVLGNAFYSNSNTDNSSGQGGSCEPGIIMVAYDKNKNGKPDDDEWFEIAGSAHKEPSAELWYNKALENGNDVNLYNNYQITYYKPEVEPTTALEKSQYIRWEDNYGNSGYKTKNPFHNQPYYPQWHTSDQLTFKGTRLPDNGIDISGKGNNYVLYKFAYGYADNEKNTEDDASIDIDWAINSKGQKVRLPGVDFIKIYTGVNQENGWLGENSTEITSVEDLHILGVDIKTR